MRKLFDNKKGNWVDIPEYMRFALSFSFLVGIMLVLLNGVNDHFQSEPNATTPAEAKEGIQKLTNAVPTGMDYLFLFGTLIFLISSLVFARLIPSRSSFTIIATILLIIFPFLAMFLENVWDGFQQQTLINNAFGSMYILPFMLDNLTMVILIYSLIVGVALYAKTE